jgi:hypothetical protein
MSFMARTISALAALMLSACVTAPAPIDREAIVTRHDPYISTVDPASPFMVGNGQFAMAVDITGLQTFREQYSAHSPLLTQAQWGWHSFPNPNNYTLENALRPIEAHGQTYRYPYFEDWGDVTTNPALRWLRENPHRFNLGRLGLRLRGEDGAPARFDEISRPYQMLHMWRGHLRSQFSYGDGGVNVATRVHPDRDMVLVEIYSPMVKSRRVGLDLAFPYVGAQINPDPTDWAHPERHTTSEVSRTPSEVIVHRQLDGDVYWVRMRVEEGGEIVREGPHQYAIFGAADADRLRASVEYLSEPPGNETISYDAAVADVTEHWRRYWSEGGFIDLSGTHNAQAFELERRIILSQYLTAVNSAGEYIPQEEGLYSNSWNGKFHHEMHWWHGAHFALWGREDLLERSMTWYLDTLGAAQARAAHYGRRGAWWPKMTGPNAVESPSTINPFIMWQQPHPIYLAELLYRANPTRETLQRYETVVFETANLLASYPTWNEATQLYEIGPPLVPSQENYPPRTTADPTLEIAYFHYGLSVAQQWRERLGMPPNEEWARVMAHLSPLPQINNEEGDGLYVGARTAPGLWRDAADPACGGGLGQGEWETQTTPPHLDRCLNRDHPSFVMAYGYLPGDLADAETMRRTLHATKAQWDFRQTWGWDFPMLAMTAARLGEPELAVEFLLLDAPNNQFGLSGMNPRVHLGEGGFVRDADTYFPSNGSLLAAAAMMAAGWDGADEDAPGFPADWNVRHEGLRPLP